MKGLESFVDILMNSMSSIPLNWYILFCIAIIVPGLIIFLLFTVNTILAIYFEQKVSAFMQDRLGPMEVGIFGFKGGKKFWYNLKQSGLDIKNILLKLQKYNIYKDAIYSEYSVLYEDTPYHCQWNQHSAQCEKGKACGTRPEIRPPSQEPWLQRLSHMFGGH